MFSVPTLQIRPVAQADHQQWLPLWQGYNAFYGRAGETALPEDITQATWERFLNPLEPVFALVAESEGELVGLAHYLFHRSTTRLEPVCYLQDLFADAEILLTAGGSAVFDLVIPLLRTQGLSKPVLGVLRSGCYITHDHGNYQRFLKHVEQREGLDASLRPALEVWTMVQSVPEPGLALLTGGRRDVSYDLEMPVPVRWAPRHERRAASTPTGWTVSALNDHHAYLRYDPATGPAPAVGDLVALGISHPCTTFDKWRWLPLVDDEGTITRAISTRF